MDSDSSMWIVIEVLNFVSIRPRCWNLYFTKYFRCQYINRDNLVTLVDLIPHEHHRLWLTIYNGSWSLWRRSVGRYSRSASATRTSSRLTAPGSTSTLATASNIWLCTLMLTEGIHFTRINARVQVWEALYTWYRVIAIVSINKINFFSSHFL